MDTLVACVWRWGVRVEVRVDGEVGRSRGPLEVTLQVLAGESDRNRPQQ